MYLTKTVHERLAVAEPATLAVFGPKQFLRHAVPKQLLADVLEVYRVARLCRFPVGEERLLDCRVLHALGMRPVDFGCRCCLHDTFHRVAGYARRPCDVPLAEAMILANTAVKFKKASLLNSPSIILTRF